MNTPKPGGRVLVRKIRRGRTGKLKNHCGRKDAQNSFSIEDCSVTSKIVTENVMNPNDWTVLRNMLLNCDDFSDHFGGT